MTSAPRHSEAAFETVIEVYLLGHGYVDVSRDGFDRERAIFPAVVLDFIRETQPKEWAKLEALHGPKTGEQIVADLCKWMDANGSLATFEATRYARGHKALYTLEINGETGSAMWDLHDLHRIQFYDHRDEGHLRGWRDIHVTDGEHPYMKNWWVPGLQIGYEHTFTHQFADFLHALDSGAVAQPTFRDGLAKTVAC